MGEEEEEDELSSRATATAVAEAVLLKRSHFRAGLTRTTRGGHTINFPAAAAAAARASFAFSLTKESVNERE